MDLGQKVTESSWMDKDSLFNNGCRTIWYLYAKYFKNLTSLPYIQKLTKIIYLNVKPKTIRCL